MVLRIGNACADEIKGASHGALQQFPGPMRLHRIVLRSE